MWSYDNWLLSIDFDFFVNASIDTRNICFPDGDETLTPNIQKMLWDLRYPDIKSIDIRQEEFNRLLELLPYSPAIEAGNVYSFESHAELYDVVKRNNLTSKPLHIFNLDFHHDMYCMSHSPNKVVDCGNWGRVLKEEHPDVTLTWVKCNDSDVKVIGDDIVDCYEMMSFKEFIKGIPMQKFQTIFLCRSDMWTPPHLDKYYTELEKVVIGKRVLEQREYPS